MEEQRKSLIEARNFFASTIILAGGQRSQCELVRALKARHIFLWGGSYAKSSFVVGTRM